MTEGDVVRLLNDRLMAFEGGLWVDKIQLEDDSEFAPPTSGLWLQQSCTFIPPKLIGAFVDGGQYRIQALYEVYVQAPRGTGAPAPLDLASKLVRWIHRGLVLNDGSAHVKVEKSFQSDKVRGPSLTSYPVTAEVWSYAPYQEN